jgi:hypothetical protein
MDMPQHFQPSLPRHSTKAIHHFFACVHHISKDVLMNLFHARPLSSAPSSCLAPTHPVNPPPPTARAKPAIPPPPVKQDNPIRSVTNMTGTTSTIRDADGDGWDDLWCEEYCGPSGLRKGTVVLRASCFVLRA